MLHSMHEMSFAEQVLDVVLREAAAYPDARIGRVRVRVGALLAVDPGSLRFSLEAISLDTPAEGAELEIIEEPLEGAAGESALIVEEIELSE